MDVILSLPILSYFAAPLATSWSTSLNLLFFYLTWTTLVLSHTALRIEVLGTLAVRVALWLAPSLLFLLFDALLPSLAAGLKVGGRASLPPSPRRRPHLLARQLALALLNLVLLAAVQAALSATVAALPSAVAWASGSRNTGWGWGKSRGWGGGSSWGGYWSPWGTASVSSQPPFRASTALPLPWQIIKHLLALYTAREVLSYAVHRFVLHEAGAGPIKGKVKGGKGGLLARLHAQYAHAPGRPAGAAPYALLLYADHPLPLLVSRLVPGYLPALLAVRPHLLTWLLFTALITAEETLAASGYRVVPGILMGGVARRTAAHYAAGGRGNYGPWGVLDWLCGTTVAGPGADADAANDVAEDVRDEAEKHRLAERGGDAARDAVSAIQDGVDGLKKGRKSRKKVA